MTSRPGPTQTPHPGTSWKSAGWKSNSPPSAAPQPLESYARAIYTSDLEKLPFSHDNFAPLWQLQCRETVIFMGLNHHGTQGRQPAVRLINLPPNPMAGATFGDESPFHIDLPAASLSAERFLDATSCDTYGQY